MLTTFVTFTRDDWSRLREADPLPLTEADRSVVQAVNERLPLTEVTEVYGPLARLLHLYVTNNRKLHRETGKVLVAAGDSAEADLLRPVPYVIGVAGGVAVGKSTTARILQALLGRWSEHRKVELVTTDGFLYSNQELGSRGLLARKGFPESYDQRKLVRFLVDLKSGRDEVAAPVYSHDIYDIVPGEFVRFTRPDILIVEGLNILQAGGGGRLFVSDLLDFSVYVDATEADIERWYVDRFVTLTKAASGDRSSFYHRFADVPDGDLMSLARQVWRDVNGVNLHDNIAPTRLRADLILEKGSDHAVRRIRLRKL